MNPATAAGLPDLMAHLTGPAGWRGRERFVVLVTDFAQGESFLPIWAGWRSAKERCAQLRVIAIAPHPPSREAVQHEATAAPQDIGLRAELARKWPPLTANLHRMVFEAGQVQLLLGPGTLENWLAELDTRVDTFWMTPPKPGQDAPWRPEIFKAFARMSAPGARLFSILPPTDTERVKLAADLRAVGFRVDGQPTPAHPALIHATYAPPFVPKRAPSRPTDSASKQTHALIVGAGLAGAATACALAELGWRSTLVDRRAAPAQETSGNPGGLFHGIVNAQDGRHARFNRAAALEAQRAVGLALHRPGALGAIAGLLRLETTIPDAKAMSGLLARLGLPPDYVQALDRSKASERCGLPLTHHAWFYPGGGWVRPTDLVASYLSRAAGFVSFQGGVFVERLQRSDTAWQLLDASGRVVAEAEVVVLANAGDALRLLGHPDWPVKQVRGQVSFMEAAKLPHAMPSIPLAGAGYLLPCVDGQVLFGATSQHADEDPRVRDSDHAHNLDQLSRLTGWDRRGLPAPSGGRTAWRCVAEDRLPILGAVPDFQQTGNPRSWDQPRKAPRRPGLYMFTALGSRGITWSALGGQVVASAIAGLPAPLESSLLDAVDPARFASRKVRRGSVNE